MNAWYSFSFANYYNPEKLEFGALRVLNDDTIQPLRGFDKHPHDNMEIVSIPLKGEILHRDSMGHKQTIKPNEVQVMTAGTGIFHEEWNPSSTEELNLLQLWIFPEKGNLKPSYQIKFFNPEEALNQWQALVAYTNSNSLRIHQKANISRAIINKEYSLEYKSELSMGNYLLVIDGEVEVSEHKLSKRDALAITETNSFSVKSLSDHSFILNIEVPININQNHF